MSVPDFTVQCAFGSNPGATSYTWTNLHTDPATSLVRRLSYRRGRQYELDRIEAGTGSAVLRDTVGLFDPDNTVSPFYPNVVPMTPIRARATIGGTTYELFQHFVTRWPRTLRVTNTYQEVSIQTVDGFNWLAQAGLAGKSYAQQLSGTRIGNVLTDAGWSATTRDIDAGNSTVQAVTFADDDETKALDHLQQVAKDSEEGLLFIDGAGYVVFIQRQALIQAPYTTSQATFSDATSGGVYQYQNLEPSYDVDHVVNEWRGTRQGGSATLVAADSTSKTKNGFRADQFSSLVTTDTEVLNQAQWRLNKTKNPLNRIESITVMPADNTALWQLVLGLEIGERITVKETPPGFDTGHAYGTGPYGYGPYGGAPVGTKTKDYHIQSIQVDLPVGPATQASFTFGLFPADLGQYWLAATAGYSEAGTTTKAAY